MKLLDVKRALRNGPYAWPGGYPQFFWTMDGAALSFAAVRQNWREVVGAHLSNARHSGWMIAGVDVNWEDGELYCAHTDTRIPSAYAEPEEED